MGIHHVTYDPGQVQLGKSKRKQETTPLRDIMLYPMTFPLQTWNANKTSILGGESPIWTRTCRNLREKELFVGSFGSLGIFAWQSGNRVDRQTVYFLIHTSLSPKIGYIMIKQIINHFDILIAWYIIIKLVNIHPYPSLSNHHFDVNDHPRMAAEYRSQAATPEASQASGDLFFSLTSDSSADGLV